MILKFFKNNFKKFSQKNNIKYKFIFLRNYPKKIYYDFIYIYIVLRNFPK